LSNGFLFDTLWLFVSPPPSRFLFLTILVWKTGEFFFSSFLSHSVFGVFPFLVGSIFFCFLLDIFLFGDNFFCFGHFCVHTCFVSFFGFLGPCGVRFFSPLPHGFCLGKFLFWFFELFVFFLGFCLPFFGFFFFFFQVPRTFFEGRPPWWLSTISILLFQI